MAKSRALPWEFNSRSTGTLPASDGRSREAQFRKRLRTALEQHIGGKPSITQNVLIALAVDTALEIERMKARRDANGGSLTIHDHKAFLGFVNSYRRHLVALGLDGAATQPPDLETYLASKAA